MLDLGGSATEVGLSFAAWTVAQVATLAFGGVIGDRFPRRARDDRLRLSRASCVRTAMGVLLVTGHAQVWELIVLQALGGAAVAFYNPAFYGLVREVVRRGAAAAGEQLPRRSHATPRSRSARRPAARSSRPSAPATALLFDGGHVCRERAAPLAGARRVRSRAPAQSFVRELREGWSAFVEHTWVWVLVLWIALYFLITYAPFFVLGPYIAKHSMSGASSWGVVVTGEGIGALLGSLAGLRFRPSRPLVATGAALPADAIQSVLLAFHAPVELLAPARCARRVRVLVRLGRLGYGRAADRSRPTSSRASPRTAGWARWCSCRPGTRLPGRSRRVVGMRGYLLFGAGWLVASTIFVVRLRSVREITSRAPPIGNRGGAGLMPRVPVPEEVVAVLAKPYLGVVATCGRTARRTPPPPGTSGRTDGSC